MEALGRLFDVVAGVLPVDFASGAKTGNRVHLKNAGGVTIVAFTDQGTASEDDVFTLQEADAKTGGTAQDLAIIDHWYQKSSATLGAATTWTKQTQTAAATVTGVGENAEIIVIEVDAAELSDGFEWILVNTNDPGTTAGKIGAVLYFLRDLEVQRAPANLADPNA